MASCKLCIHDKVCDMWAVESGLPFVNADMCEHFNPIVKEQQKYFSPQDVQNMTKEEVQANYQAIMESMKEW